MERKKILNECHTGGQRIFALGLSNSPGGAYKSPLRAENERRSKVISYLPSHPLILSLLSLLPRSTRLLFCGFERVRFESIDWTTATIVGKNYRVRAFRSDSRYIYYRGYREGECIGMECAYQKSAGNACSQFRRNSCASRLPESSNNTGGLCTDDDGLHACSILDYFYESNGFAKGRVKYNASVSRKLPLNGCTIKFVELISVMYVKMLSWIMSMQLYCE